MLKKNRFVLLGTGFSPSFAVDPNAVELTAQPSGTRHYIGGVIFVMASMAFMFYWCGFPLADSYFVDGFTRFGTPPSPNNWESSRYTWGWWNFWLLGLNMLLPYLLSAALLNNTVPEYAKFHYWISWWFIWYNIVVFIMLSVQWLFFCNGGGSYLSTACNDIKWCCVYFGSSATTAQWCPNTTPCVPNYSSADLHRTGEFFQAWLFSLLFVLWAWMHRRVSKDLWNYGCFQEPKRVRVPAQVPAPPSAVPESG